MESVLSFPNEDCSYNVNVGVTLQNWATMDPGKTAFVCYDANGRRETLTTTDVLNKSLCFASYLREKGIKKGDGVVICMSRSINAIIAFYGTCCVGGVCYIINDVSDCGGAMQLLHDVDDVKFLCIDCNSSVDGWGLVETVLKSKNEAALKAIIVNGEIQRSPKRAFVESMSNIIDGRKHKDHRAANVNCCDNGNDVVFFIRKTGKKDDAFVGCPRNALFSAAANVVKRLALKDDSVIFSDQNFAHVLSATWAYVASGCTQVFLEEALKNQTNFVECVYKIIKTEGCTNVFLSSVLLEKMTQCVNVPVMPTVQSLICSGESRVPESYRRLFGAVCRSMTILYEYQGTVPVSIYTTTDPAMVTEGFMGPPLPGIAMKVINDEGNVAARDTEGSLYIQTGNKIYNKTGTSKQGDWIRSGYKALMRSDNNIVLTGHESELVTVGTQRFFTHQVESIILKCPGVISVVVLLILNSRLRNVLCACLIVDEDFDMDFLETFCDGIWSTPNSLVKSCRRPNYFIVLDEFPRNSEGAVNKEILSKRARVKLWPESQVPARFF